MVCRPIEHQCPVLELTFGEGLICCRHTGFQNPTFLLIFSRLQDFAMDNSQMAELSEASSNALHAEYETCSCLRYRFAVERVAGVTGLEPAAFGVTGRRSNQLSYTPAMRVSA